MTRKKVSKVANTLEKEKESPLVIVCCVNNSGMRNEYSTNAMFMMGWYAGANGIRAGSYTFDNHPISLARNVAMKVFEDNPKFTHLFFVDSDTVPPAETIVRLLSYDLPIVSGWYLSRRGNGLPVILKIVGKNVPKLTSEVIKDSAKFPEWQAMKLDEFLIAPKEKNGLVKVDGVGAGCLLIKREVLTKLSKPYFYEDHLLPHSFGEDLFFALNCKINGVPIYVDPNVFCAHWNWGLIDIRHVKALIQRIRSQQQQQEQAPPIKLEKPPQ